MKEYAKPIHCYLKTIAPIHLGCDEVYEPLNFVVDEEHCRLMVFEPWVFFCHMSAPEQQRFTALCQKGTISSILEIYKFMRGRQVPGKAVAVCPGLVEHYRQTLKLPLGQEKKIKQELNNFTIARTAFLAYDERPYIPGSAIKGALRTAYLNHLAQEKTLPRTRSAHELEMELLEGGSFATDPFRMLKVSDFLPVGEVQTRVLYVVNEKKKLSPFPARGPYQILEVIEPGSIFVGTITIDRPERQAGIRTPIERPLLFQSAAWFYGQQKAREDEELLDIGIKPAPAPAVNSDFLLRLGRHSGAESVTIAGHRHIKIMQGRGEPTKFEDHSTTLWLAAEDRKQCAKETLRPFGWALMAELSEAQVLAYEEQETAWRQHREQQITPTRATKAQKPEPVPVEPIKTDPVEKLKEELKLIKPEDAGRLGTIIQKIETLETPPQKAALARAIQEHLGSKRFKKHKRRDYLLKLIESDS
ncbi:MAG: type III-A CRISPR-associated RAMP protein Csm5 [Desulfobacca sp.]|nr:type III-A CRISPR-associated RAMP protein Csm5 [Desulfobacca sp.]